MCHVYITNCCNIYCVYGYFYCTLNLLLLLQQQHCVFYVHKK